MMPVSFLCRQILKESGKSALFFVYFLGNAACHVIIESTDGF